MEELNRLNIIRHIKGTTGIEGNTLNEEKIGDLIPPGKDAGSLDLEEREVVNAYEVMAYVSRLSPGDLVITEELIRELHALNTRGGDYPGNTPGEYRRIQVTAGDYSPPAAVEVPGLMRQFTRFINNRKISEGLGPLIRAVLAHFYLVSIHPFVDGNGRTSRALEACLLYHGGYNIHGFYSLANFYYQNRRAYIQKLQDARFRYHGDLNDWVKFSLHGFLSELEKLQENILSFVRRVLFRDYVLEMFRKDLINWRILNLMEYLISDRPYLGLEEFRSRRHYLVESIYKKYKGGKTLQRDLKTMQDLGLVAVKEGKLYPNLDLLDAL